MNDQEYELSDSGDIKIVEPFSNTILTPRLLYSVMAD